jgi:hypothetical protein
MLDRFPTELITLIVDVTSTSAWQRTFGPTRTVTTAFLVAIGHE